jgi:predicted  nucleic acid-binding Zn-ribbon protein
LKIEVSNGEILDKVSILEIKLERILDLEKVRNIRKEYAALQNAVQHIEALVSNLEDYSQATAELRSTNEALWDVEDALRLKEKARDFGDTFITLAREVYVLNDRRAALKSTINNLTGSNLREEKSYEGY